MNRDEIPGLQAEAALIGCLMIDPGCAERIADVGVEDSMFGDPFHRIVWRLAVDLQAQGKDSDVMSLLVALEAKGMPDTLPALNGIVVNAITSRNARMFAQEVIAGFRRRELLRVAAELHDLAADTSASPTATLDSMQALLGTVRMSAGQKGARRLYDVAAERVDRMQQIAEGTIDEVGWASGIPSLDRMLGRFRPGNLYIVAARPSVGKSSFSEHLGIRFAELGQTVLFLSQEMPEGDLADRAISNVGGVDHESLTRNRCRNVDWKGVADGLDRIKTLPFWIDDEAALTLGALRRKVLSRPGLSVLILDYLQLCSVPGKDTRATEIGQISAGLKALAKERSIVVIALSQLSREVERRTPPRPVLSDLRDSGAIEQDADAVIFLWRNGKPDPDGPQLVGCDVPKVRDGRVGALTLSFDGDRQRWGESTVPIQDRLRRDPAQPTGGLE